MKDDFIKNDYADDVRRIFEHLETENKFKATIFGCWKCRLPSMKMYLPKVGKTKNN